MSARIELPAAGATASGTICGAAGDIEILLARPQGELRGIAVSCHPHPLFGGAMSNKVVYALDSVAQKFGMMSARFNFRGVGRSQGEHDKGVGEMQDCLRVIQWLREQCPGQSLLLCGFSFGAFISLSVAAQASPAALVSIAPPFGKYVDDLPEPNAPACPWLVLHSRDDEVVAFNQTRDALARYQPAPELVEIDGAGHFFHGRLQDIRNHVSLFLGRHWAPA